MKKKIIILGSTGSIGSSTIKIINRDKNQFEVTLLTANKNYKKLFLQAKKTKCKNIVIHNKEKYFEALVKNNNLKLKIFNSMNDFLKKSKHKVDYTMSAITGIAGLQPTIDIIKVSKNLAIANKESIICGWNLIEKEMTKYNSKFIPVDSEHFSILSLIKDYEKSQIETIFITASGGPFLNLPKIKFKKITSDRAVKHPNWKMGKKISIDSSTLMNKVFEVIEAQRIFNLPLSKFKILIHPNSYVHAIVKFNNGITKFLVHDTNMEIPIFNCLYNENKNKRLKSNKIDFNKINKLNFTEVDNSKFPLINILKKIPNRISLFDTVLVSANDNLVELFLQKKISYLDISKYIKKISELKQFTKLKLVRPKSVQQIQKLSKYVALKIKSLSVISQQL